MKMQVFQIRLSSTLKFLFLSQEILDYYSLIEIQHK